MALLRAIRALQDLSAENDDQKVGIRIVKKALQNPARQIFTNGTYPCWRLSLAVAPGKRRPSTGGSVPIPGYLGDREPSAEFGQLKA